MDILIIDPPQVVLKGLVPDRGYNVGPVSLAAYLRKEGIESAVLTGDLLVDYRITNPLVNLIHEWRISVKSLANGQLAIENAVNDRNHIVWQKLIEVVCQTNPKVVGIPYFTPLKYLVDRVASLVKEVNPDIKVVVGAFHPTFCPEDAMRNPNFDFVIRGEGEIALTNLMKELKKDNPKWETVPGICYRDKDGKMKSTIPVNLIADLDELPYLGRDLVLNCDYDVYRVHSMSTTRGCPYTCSFCADRRFWNGKVRRRSVVNVIKEMKFLKEKFKPASVDFVDGTFTYDRKYVQAFCQSLINERLDINWWCTARFDTLDKDLLKLMKRANCSGLYFGLESGSNRVLQSIDKKMTVENMVEVSKMVHDAGIMSISSLVLGLPDETKEDIEKTLKLMKTFKTDFFDVNIYTPLPGSPLGDSVSEEEMRKIDWAKVAYKSFSNYFSQAMSEEDFRKNQLKAYQIADNVRRRSIIRMGIKKVSSSMVKKFKKSNNGLGEAFFSYS
ncbi:MAG: B12-binding domain-containing radical SAM protein [Dehalococcoidales bacterium]